jgi:DNA polymerase I-like protein with 3'-5' exonuclease and polymerase domains
LSKRQLFVPGQLHMLEPPSTWSPPAGPLPDLREVDVAIDTETKDGGLARGRGPGWVYGDGYVLGVSVAWGNQAMYVPMRHPDTENRDCEQVIRWVESLIRNCRTHFFNMGYDAAWLQQEGCTAWPARAEDAQAMAVMLDENWDEYSLDACCARAGVPGKDERLLKEAAAAHGIAPVNGSIKHGLYLLPARHVGPYAEQDATATLALCRALLPALREERLEGPYRTEMELMRVVHEMRRRGIRISTSEAERAREGIRGRLKDALAAIETPPRWRRHATIDDLRSPERLAEIFDAEGVTYPRTPKTKAPSFTKTWLEQLDHPLGAQVRRARQLEDLAEKFLGTYILEHEHRGRIHAEVHQLRTGEGGTVTSRFSYSNPPLQQMPSRDPELAPFVRGVFLPEPDEDWLAADYKSQEPRLVTHYAAVSKKVAARYGIQMGDVESLVRYYREDPNPDPHMFTAKILGRTRKQSKDITQGLSYRMKPKKLALMMGVDLETATGMYDEFHAKIPYIQGLAQFSERRALERGYIRMIDGARRHFPKWEPAKWDLRDGTMHRLAAAQAQWPGVQLMRAEAFQAMNSLIQGSAARQTKIAMVRAHSAGHLPLVQMHDEIGFSVSSARQCAEIGAIMAEAVQLVIPVTVDMEVGRSWGLAKTEYREYYNS